jgi:hypothetical protein
MFPRRFAQLPTTVQAAGEVQHTASSPKNHDEGWDAVKQKSNLGNLPKRAAELL